MKHFFLFLIFTALISCSRPADDNYKSEIDSWRTSRIERLKSKTGWLNLAGLYWLREGENTFGSDTSNTIVFPPKASLFYGSILRKGDSLFFTAKKGIEVNIDGNSVTQSVLYPDVSGRPSIFESGSLTWFIIKRDSLYAIRLRDYEHPRINQLDSIPCYETSPGWRIKATFVPYVNPRIIETMTVTGGREINHCPGELVFRKGLKKYTLLPFAEGNELFIIFADRTNGFETYGNGRFLYASLPDSANKVVIDFNKAYNPPCAFSPFATCPMPPAENILDLKVKAGEKEIHLN